MLACPYLGWAKSAFDYALEGQELIQKKNFAQAINALKESTKIDPNSDWSYGLLGRAHLGLGQKAEAAAAFREADTHFRLAKAFHNVDMVANAMLEYKRTLEIKPAYTKAINEIGWIYYNKGVKENAIAQWKKTLTEMTGTQF
ncbi:MAG: tetratricopeptide repeat protein [Deltaproteobacteria bacterium]|nr:tetratricopeptide repeat protein [Deltaproteobacteria bacterium]